MDFNNKNIESLNKSKAINMLLYGSRKPLSKVCKGGRYIHKSNFFVVEEPSTYVLQWLSRKKVYQSSRIPLDQNILISDSNPQLRKQYMSKLDEKRRHLTLKYGSKNKVLVLEFENEEEKEYFKFGLEYFIHRSNVLHNLLQMETIFRKNFNENIANLNGELSTGLKPSIPLLGSASKANNKNNNGENLSVSSKNKNSNPMPNYAISNSKQFKDLCFSFGLTIDQDYLNNFYDDFTKRNQVSIITFEKFKEMLCELLARREILDLYLIFCEEEERLIDFYAPLMSNKQLQEFFRSEQSQQIKIEDINEIIKKSYCTMNSMGALASSSILKNQHLNESLSFLTFCRIILSENNSIFFHEKSLVYQDMDRPLTDYYINGMTHCFSQDSKPYLKLQSFENFLYKALDKGSRYLELLLTCLDDNHSEAVLTNCETESEDITPTSLMHQQSPIFLKDVLKALKKNAFLNNKFPLFLSLKLLKDTSLSEEGLRDTIIENLGEENLFVLPVEHKNHVKLPSPHALERKFILILAGNMPDLKSGSEYLVPLLNTTEYSENDASETKSEEGILDENPSKMTSTFSMYSHKSNKANNFKIMNSNNLILRLDEAGSEEDEEEEKRASLYKQTYEANLLVYLEQLKENIKGYSHQNDHKKGINSYNFPNNHREKIGTGEIQRKFLPKLSPKIIEKQYRANKPKIKALKNNGLLSLGCFFEARIPLDKDDEDLYKINTYGIKDLKKHKKTELIRFHQRHLSLVYNFVLEETNGMLLYQTGAQINYFHPNGCQDLAVLANFSKFQENGGCNSGFLLKPASFLQEMNIEESKNAEVDKAKMYLNIMILSASQLKSSENNKPVSPFIEIGLKGCDFDEQNNKIYRTKTVVKNGFNPIFDDNVLCEFSICQPELTVVYFQVWDQGHELEESRFLGWYAVPVNCIRGGFRVVPLRDLHLAIIDKSVLFCRVETRVAEIVSSNI